MLHAEFGQLINYSRQLLLLSYFNSITRSREERYRKHEANIRMRSIRTAPRELDT